MREDRIARLVRETRELIIAKDWIADRKAKTLQIRIVWNVAFLTTHIYRSLMTNCLFVN